MALTTDKMDQSVSSEMSGNPPLWIARRDAGVDKYDMYVNDAKLVRGNIKATSSRQDEQVIGCQSINVIGLCWALLDLTRFLRG